MRTVVVGLCVLALALLPACSRNRTPNSLFDAAGYHVTDDKVFYLNAFPGKAFQIDGADVASFQAFDQTYARDKSNVYLNGGVLSGADAATFLPLERPGFAKDAHHIYQRDVAISADPAHFELLDGELSKDGSAVYWSDGRVLSEDPAHFVIISNVDHYLFTKDAETVQVNGNRSTKPTPPRSACSAARTRLTVSALSTSPTGFRMPALHRCIRSRVRTRATRSASTGWARPSTAPIRRPSACSTRPSSARPMPNTATTDRPSSRARIRARSRRGAP
jgi:hypothetical protein